MALPALEFRRYLDENRIECSDSLKAFIFTKITFRTDGAQYFHSFLELHKNVSDNFDYHKLMVSEAILDEVLALEYRIQKHITHKD
jgi:arginine/lysine/ornithine decarboxylase